jgi:hypothetical protein
MSKFQLFQCCATDYSNRIKVAEEERSYTLLQFTQNSSCFSSYRQLYIRFSAGVLSPLFRFRSNSSTLLVRDTFRSVESFHGSYGPQDEEPRHRPSTDAVGAAKGNLLVLGRDVQELTLVSRQEVQMQWLEYFLVERNNQTALKAEEARAHPPPKFTRTHRVLPYFPTLLHPRFTPPLNLAWLLGIVVLGFSEYILST